MSDPPSGAPATDPAPEASSAVFTVPNLITVARLACLPWFLWLLFGAEDRFAAALVLALVGATDWVDGVWARHFGSVSELGKVLDPVADRLVFLVAVVAIVVDGAIPVWLAVAVLAREGLVTVAALVIGAMGARRIDVTWWGKTATFALLFAFPLLLGGASDVDGADVLRWLGWACAVPGLIISYVSAAQYLPRARRALADGRAARSPR